MPLETRTRPQNVTVRGKGWVVGMVVSEPEVCFLPKSLSWITSGSPSCALPAATGAPLPKYLGGRRGGGSPGAGLCAGKRVNLKTALLSLPRAQGQRCLRGLGLGPPTHNGSAELC